MTKMQFYVGLYVLILIIIFIVDYILNRFRLSKKHKKNKNKEIMEISYLCEKFKLDKKRLPMGKLSLLIAFFNAFIISTVAITVILCDTYLILQLLIGFILLLGLIYAIYEIMGRILVKVGYGKNGK